MTPDFLPDHSRLDTQTTAVRQEPLSPSANEDPMTSNQALAGNQNPAGQPIVSATPISGSVDLLDPTLMLAADVVDDLERVKIANQNRLRTLTSPFEEGGAGLSEAQPDVARLAAMVTAMEKLEHDAILQLQRAMRRHPLGPWVKAQKGVGEKQAARLLAAIGDPYINSATGRPRTVSALWAYSGLHVLPASQIRFDAHTAPAGGNQTSNPGQKSPADHTSTAGVAAKRRKGEKANWSTNAKTRAYLVATSCMKQAPGNHFRDVYDRRRAHTAITHPDWTPGHSHQDALRVVSKEILKQLWVAARDIHQGATL